MVFYKVASADPVIKYITGLLSSRLQNGKKVLWLVPGGSNVRVAAEVSKHLSGLPLQNLIVTLTDERYGPAGHPDSNWLQLEQAGFALPGATMLPVLANENLDAAVAGFNKLLEENLDAADYRLGFFGMGADGHTAGILPHSPAASSPELAAGYDAGQYQRMTTTPAAIARLDEAVVYAAGQSKRQALDQLEEDVKVDDQPAQVLKRVPKLTIFNDQKGETL
jgi:6-phosphogluconolactonase